ncbi:MAG: hypothetical protein IRZ28_17135 [Steroidobacteraceae bacterium]|nr:hypothetical protein [Steroidobacteraceae bacterium]
MVLSAEALEVQRRLREDTPFWAKHCAKILTPDKRLVPLVARPWQLELDEALERQRRQGLPMRAIILKARKLGFSTWVTAKFMQRVTQMPNRHAIVVAQDTKTAGELFRMAERIYHHLPTEEELGLGFSIKPHLVNASFSENGRKFMQFGERAKTLRQRSLDSMYEMDTANTPASGRGTTPSELHGSEVAHWPDNGKLLALLNAVPEEQETIVVLESTANGRNHFFRRWQRAVEGEEDPEVGGSYVPIFAPWWRDPACTARFRSEEDRERFVAAIGEGVYGEEEPTLIERFGCTPEQLLWRRRTIRERCDDSIELFHQEYPASPEEAFIGSGNTVFSSVLISRAIGAAEKAPEPVRGWLRGEDFVTKRTRGGTVEVPQRAVWVPESEARKLPQTERPPIGADLLKVWEHPVNALTEAGKPEGERREDGCYVVFVDVAGDPEASGRDGDRHCIQVIDHISKMQVATWAGRIDHAELRVLALLVALYYNNAWLAVEVTGGAGLPVAVPLQQDYRYRYMYRRREVDTRTERELNKVGWDTNRRTKPLMEGAMLDAFKDGTHGIRDLATALEFNTYVVLNERGEHGAVPGEHDDRVMAWMGAQYLAGHLRPRRKKKNKRGRVRGFEPIDPTFGW